jgi:HK97 family phage prohead protease
MQAKTRSFLVKDLGTVTGEGGQEFGQIEAYGAITGNVDETGDRIVAGAFKSTLRAAKDRAASRSTKYVLPMLWQHDTHEIIGGWSSVTEDSTGLKARGDISLATQRGREYYALAKAGMTDQFSIIYDIPTGGAHYDKSGVRDLTELRLFSIDPVTFAAAADATTGGFNAEHVAKLQRAAKKAAGAVDQHVSALKDEANSVRDLIGSGQKAGRMFSAENAQALSDHADALDNAADTLQKTVGRQVKAITSVADDLATILQGSEGAYGSDPGTPAPGQQEGKAIADALAYLKGLEARYDSTRTGGRTAIFQGYLSTWDRNSDGDKVVPGAFTQTIADAKARAKSGQQAYMWPLLIEHEYARIVGGITDAVEDAHGLKVEAYLDLSTSEGIEAWDALKRGKLDSLSVGGTAADIERDYENGTGKPVRLLKQLSVEEGSLTAWPVNAQAAITSYSA